MRSSLETRIECLEQEFGEAGCVCGEHKIGAVEVQNDWSEERMLQADKTAWFECAVHGRRPPELLVRIVRFTMKEN
jgi:hypothetical protein